MNLNLICLGVWLQLVFDFKLSQSVPSGDMHVTSALTLQDCCAGSAVAAHRSNTDSAVGLLLGAAAAFLVGVSVGASGVSHFPQVRGQAASARDTEYRPELQYRAFRFADFFIQLHFFFFIVPSEWRTRALVSLQLRGQGRRHVSGHMAAASGRRRPAGGLQYLKLASSKLSSRLCASQAQLRFFLASSKNVALFRSSQDWRIRWSPLDISAGRSASTAPTYDNARRHKPCNTAESKARRGWTINFWLRRPVAPFVYCFYRRSGERFFSIYDENWQPYWPIAMHYIREYTTKILSVGFNPGPPKSVYHKLHPGSSNHKPAVAR